MASRDDKTIRLRTVLDSDTKGAVNAAGALKKEREEADKLSTSLGKSTKATDKLSGETEKLGDGLKETARDARTLEQELKDLYEERRKVIQKYDETADDSVLKERNRINSRIRAIKAMRKEFAEVLDEGGHAAGGLAKMFSGLGDVAGPMKAGLIVGLVEAVAIASPLIGAMLAGSVAGLGGTLGVAGGVVAAFQSPDVKTALHTMGSAIADEFADAGAGLVPEVIKSLSILKGAFTELNLGHSFELAAPSIEIVAKGIANLARNFMPGFNRMLERATPFAEVFAQGMGDLGTALGNFFDKSSRSEGALAGLASLFDFLAATITTTGSILEWFSDRYMDMINMIGSTAGFLGDLAGVLGEQGLASAFHGISLKVDEFKSRLPGATTTVLEFGDATGDTSREAERLADALTKSNAEFDKLFGIAMDVDKANIAVKRGLLELNEEFKKGNVDWRDSTEAGLRHREMLVQQVEALKNKRDAEIAASDGSKAAVDKANDSYDKAIKKLEAMAVAAGAAKGLASDLAGTYTVTFQLKQEVIGKQVVAWSEFRNQERKGTAPASAPVSVYGGGRASGGPVMAGVAYDINEKRGERVTFPANGSVDSHPANLTPAGGGMQMSGRPVMVNGDALAEMFMRWLRNEIGAQGGTLAVLGIKD